MIQLTKREKQQQIKLFKIAKDMHLMHVLKYACYQIAYWRQTEKTLYPNSKIINTTVTESLRLFLMQDETSMRESLNNWNTYMRDNTKGRYNYHAMT
jgi:hypothetical protein